MTREQRFMDKISPEPNSGCWLWIAGVTTREGYGQFWDGNKIIYAHRFSYERVNGNIPEGLHIDHLCNVRCCVNPDHLEAVTLQENIKRRDDRGRQVSHNKHKTHCIRGHLFDEKNTYVRNDTGARMCRKCGKIRQRRYK